MGHLENGKSLGDGGITMLDRMTKMIHSKNRWSTFLV
jgi:NADH:ubiquinone oxidoreductase subunit F (NADH-binding)